MNSTQQDPTLSSWQERQEYAELMQPLIGKLYRNFGVEILVYGRSLLNVDTINIIKAHRLIRRYEGQKVRLRESFPFLEAMAKMQLAPGRVDLGKLAYGYLFAGKDDGLSVEDYIRRELSDIVDVADSIEPRDVVLYGFGRIGRLLARLLIERNGANNKMRLRAIVVRGGREGDLEKRASLLRRDSIHGQFNGSITVDKENNSIKANGTSIRV
ncbi:MAG: glyceraldehyde-3-phosphate dehydrogenase, partial [Idiomarina sp.]